LEYAPLFANMMPGKLNKQTQDAYVNLMLDPIMYTDPRSLLLFKGPIKPRETVQETYEFPSLFVDVVAQQLKAEAIDE